jgi:COMPASS component SWD3
MFLKRHWLDIAEISSLFISIVGLIIGLIVSEYWYIIMPMFLTIMINFINGLRREYLVSSKLNKLDSQQKQLAEKIADLEQQVEASKTVLSDPITSETNEEKLAILEKSLTQIVQYLNQASLPERVKNLETLIQKSPSVSPVKPLSNSLSDPSLSSPEIPRWKLTFSLTEHQDGITSLAISPDGQFLASVSWDETLKIWSLTTGKELISSQEQHQGLLSVIFTNIVDNNHNICYNLATGGFNQNIYLWQFNPTDNSLVLSHTLTGHIGSIRTLKTAHSGLTLISGSYDQTIKQWDLTKFSLSHSSYDPLGDIHSLAIFPNRDLIAAAGGDGRITIWQLGDGHKIKVLIGNIYSVESLAISENQEIIVAGCIDGKIRFWSWDNNTQISQVIDSFLAHSGPVIFLEFDRDQHLLYSGGADGTIKIWYLDYDQEQSIRPRLLTTLEITDESTNHLHRVLSIAFSPDHLHLAIGTVDGLIKIQQKLS